MEDFIPNGSRVIETGAGIPRYFEEGKARFSSGDQLTFSSPDGRSNLLLENTAQKRGKGLWLVLRSRGVQNSEPIIISERPIEVLWSPLSDTFAVNHWADPNACDVFAVVIGDAQRTFSISLRCSIYTSLRKEWHCGKLRKLTVGRLMGTS